MCRNSTLLSASKGGIQYFYCFPLYRENEDREDLMKKLSFFSLAVAGAFLFASLANATNPVVVIPLKTNQIAGTDGQIQYNDDGKSAGAEVYYDKATGRVGVGTSSPTAPLEVKGEILTTDANGAARLWGEGRPGVTIFNDTWTDSTMIGIQVASSNTYVTWGGVAAGCPANTWVCTFAERGTGTVATPDLNFTSCDGITSMSDGRGRGRVADASLHAVGPAYAKNVYENGEYEFSHKCNYYYAWCCRDKP